MQANMDVKGCKTYPKFRAALEKEVKAVPQHYTRRLFAGMSKRVSANITLGGDLTKH